MGLFKIVPENEVCRGFYFSFFCIILPPKGAEMPINRDQIAERLGFKRSDIDMLLAMFSKNAATSFEEMQTMIAEKNMQGIADAAHAIKGSAGNLKLDNIYNHALMIEMAAKQSEDLDYAAAHEQLGRLLDAV